MVKKKRTPKRRRSDKLTRLLRKLPIEQQQAWRRLLAWFESDEPERLIEWWLELGGSLDDDLKDVRMLRDEWSQRFREREIDDPRRGKFAVPAGDVLKAFDAMRQYSTSDTDCAKKVATQLKVSRNVVLRRVAERRARK